MDIILSHFWAYLEFKYVCIHIKGFHSHHAKKRGINCVPKNVQYNGFDLAKWGTSTSSSDDDMGCMT